MAINLSENPVIVEREAAHFAFIEKHGPFMKTAPQAWQEFWMVAATSIDQTMITGKMGIHREAPRKGEPPIYQAGVTLRSLPNALKGLKLRSLPPGKYACFLLHGSYAQLSGAYPHIFALLPALKLTMRDEFCIESYLNSPQDTPEDQLKTEILIPVK